MSTMDPETQKKVAGNLFPCARVAVEPWEQFPWHLGSNGHCDTWQPHSSQAMAIDVFGSMKVVEQAERDAVLAALARSLSMPEGGSWSVALEWLDPANRLKERRRTQVDAVARSARSLIFFECKFTEPAGRCSQTRSLPGPAHVGMVQCDGSYRLQTNPTNRKESRCALAGKGIRYWEVVPEVFRYQSDADHVPCPFAGTWFQLMRNLTLCWEVARDERLKPGFVIIYIDAPGLPFPEGLNGAEWLRFTKALRAEAIAFRTMSYQSLVELAKNAVLDSGRSATLWEVLGGWVERKIKHVTHGKTATDV